MSFSFGSVDYQATNAAASLLSAGFNESLLLLKVTALNTDASPHTITIWRVPNGGSTSNAELLVDAQALAVSGAPVVLKLSGQALVNQAMLYAQADANSVVNLSLSYLQTP